METTGAEGMIREAAGKIEQTVGAALGDTGEQISGKTKELYGKTQQLCADAASVARDAMADSPLATLGVALGAGFLLGALWSWNRATPYDDAPANGRRR